MCIRDSLDPVRWIWPCRPQLRLGAPRQQLRYDGQAPIRENGRRAETMVEPHDVVGRKFRDWNRADPFSDVPVDHQPIQSLCGRFPARFDMLTEKPIRSIGSGNRTARLIDLLQWV